MVRTSIVLAVVAAALLAFIVFVERGTVSQGERDMRQGRVLDRFVRDRTARIELQRKGVTVVFVRKPDKTTGVELGSWMVEAPFAAKADQDAVESVLSALEWINARRKLGELSKDDVTQFRLDKPRYRLRLLVGREQVGFAVGNESPDGAGVYLRVDGEDAAYVVTKDLLEALNHEPEHFHTKELHDGFSVYAVRKAVFRDAGSEYAIEKRDEDFWLQKPEQALVSEPIFGEVISALDALRATRYVAAADSQQAKTAIGSPVFEVQLDLRTFDVDGSREAIEKKLHLQAGGACPEHAGESFVRVDGGPLVCVADADLAKARKTAAELREARMLTLDDSQIHGVTVTVGKRRLVLNEEGDDWRYEVTDDGRKISNGVADSAAVTDWWNQLRAAKAERFTAAGAAPLAEDGIGTVTRSLRIQRIKDKPSYEIRFGRTDEGLVAASRNAAEPLVLWFAQGAVDLVSTETIRFRKLRILTEDAGAFESLRIVRPEQPTLVATKTGSTYRFEPEDGPAALTRDAVDEIVRLVSSLEAVRFVADTPLPEHGLDTPSYRIEISYRATEGQKAIRHTLTLGAATEGGRYAQLDADRAVFIVPNALVEQIP